LGGVTAVCFDIFKILVISRMPCMSSFKPCTGPLVTAPSRSAAGDNGIFACFRLVSPVRGFRQHFRKPLPESEVVTRIGVPATVISGCTRLLLGQCMVWRLGVVGASVVRASLVGPSVVGASVFGVSAVRAQSAKAQSVGASVDGAASVFTVSAVGGAERRSHPPFPPTKI
jgi:hypothetical protein